MASGQRPRSGVRSEFSRAAEAGQQERVRYRLRVCISELGVVSVREEEHPPVLGELLKRRLWPSQSGEDVLTDQMTKRRKNLC